MIKQLLYAMLLSALTTGAWAQEVAGSFDQWRVFTYSKEGKKLCYIASLPAKKTGNYNKRSEAYLLVTHKTPFQDEVSLSSGYRYKDDKDVMLDFGQRQYKLFTKDELAWAYDAAADQAIVKDMMRGSEVTVKGESWKGTQSQDTYALKGFTAAHQQMKELCQ